MNFNQLKMKSKVLQCALGVFFAHTLWAQPLITSITPSSAIPGSQVTILGGFFDPTSKVEFGEIEATVTFAAANEYRVIVPSGLVGPVSLVVTSEGQSSPSYTNFTIINPGAGGAFSVQKTISVEVDNPWEVYSAYMAGDGDMDVLSASALDNNPNFNFSGEPEPNGRRINMGAYGGTSEATMSAASPSQLLVALDWKFSSLILDSAEVIRECEEDNVFSFEPDGSMSVDFGALTGSGGGSCDLDGFLTLDGWEMNEAQDTLRWFRGNTSTSSPHDTVTYAILTFDSTGWTAIDTNMFGTFTAGYTAVPLGQTFTQVTFTVNSTDDLGDFNTGDGICQDGLGNCTLRAAIEQANATPGTDNIEFDIPGPGPHTFQPTSALPTITDPVIIDGTTEPDFVGTPMVELDGTNAGNAIGLHFTTTPCSLFPMALLPVQSVPIKFPEILLRSVPKFVIHIPAWFPDIRFLSTSDEPPIMFSCAPQQI